ncbi:hypothetical protein [Agromyces bauzanensis]
MSTTPEELGERWDAFYNANVLPLIDLVIAAGLFWLAGLVIARLISLLPWWRRVEIRRTESAGCRGAGYALVTVGALLFVGLASIPATTPEIWYFMVAATAGLLGAIVLGLGMATTPRISATVVGASGDENAAWEAELLTRMRELNADDPRGRVEKPSGSDLNEVIAVSDQTGNAFVKFIGGALAMLFNLAPWRLQVTIFDGRSGTASLRRNGRFVEDVPLELPRDAVDPTHPAELLILAAAFGAKRVADHYPDITGFYNATDWQGIGMLRVARIAEGAARRTYLAKSVEKDPGNILTEYEQVHGTYAGATDPDQLVYLIDRLEPMINIAARLCGRTPVLEEVRYQPWHAASPFATNEPRLLMLRLMTLYTTAIRNWSVAEGSPGRLTVEERYRRAIKIVGALLDALGEPHHRPSPTERDAIRRMQDRAGVCYLLLLAKAGEIAPLVVTDPGHATRLELARQWSEQAADSIDIEVRYSYVCYLARTASPERSVVERDAIADKLEAVCRVDDEYRSTALTDPELQVLGAVAEVRAVVLPPIADAWDIERFAAQKRALLAAGVATPTALADRAVVIDLLERGAFRRGVLLPLHDGAEILAAGLAVRSSLDERARLRAVRCLLDERGHTVATLNAEADGSAEELVAAVAKAVFWVPDDAERRTSARFLAELVDHVGAAAR